MSANETSATIMASSLGVVVGDRGTDTTTRRLGGEHRLPGDPVGSCGAPLGWPGTWAARAQIGSGGGRCSRRMESQGRAPPSRDRRRGLKAILAVNGQTGAAGQGGQAAGAAALGADMKEILLLRQRGTLPATLWRPAGPPGSLGAGGGGALMRQSAFCALHQQRQRSLPGLASFHTAPMTTHHTQSEPHQRPKQRRHDRVPPQRPGEGPEQELESDPVGVLNNEDQEDPDTGERRDRPAAQFAPVRLLPIWLSRHHVLLMSRSTGGFGATVCHLGGAAALAWPAAVQPRPRPVVTPRGLQKWCIQLLRWRGAV